MMPLSQLFFCNSLSICFLMRLVVFSSMCNILASPSVFKVTTKDKDHVRTEGKEMKKKVIIGIVAGVVVVNIAFFGLVFP